MFSRGVKEQGAGSRVMTGDARGKVETSLLTILVCSVLDDGVTVYIIKCIVSCTV